MALGKHIVTELQLNDRGDWLRHWMAHHVAELIREAEAADDAKTRKQAATRATETILKIWGHRANSPGDVNPLARYREALEALLELRAKPEPWSTFGGLSPSSTVLSIYRRFPKLIEALVLLPAVRAGNRDRATSQAVRKFLSQDEKRLLGMLEIRLVGMGDEEDREATAKPKGDYQRFEEAANKLIDEMIADLRSVREGDKSGPSVRRRRTLIR